MKTMRFLKGMGAGMVVGACIGMAVATDKKRRSRFLCSLGKTVNGLIDDVSDMMGM